MTFDVNKVTEDRTPSGKFSLYPWLQKDYKEFVQNGIPNSLLIHGEKDIGKLNLGIHLANYLICENKKGTYPCQTCNACHWFQKGNHPDFFAILPEDSYELLPFEIDSENIVTKNSEEKKQSKFIRIDQVRDILNVNERSSYRGGRRVILIYPVESMRVEAANCLLKSLEEPLPDVFFILISHRLDTVLPTIRSRCRLLAASKPSQEDSIEWLSQQPIFRNKSQQELNALYYELRKISFESN
jgi:DNA polymerase-3 subunit delta'